MFERTRDSWRMTSGKFKLRLLLALLLIFLLFIGLVWVLRSWHGGYQPSHEPVAAIEGSEIRKLEEMGLAGNLAEKEAGPMSFAEREVLDRHFSAMGGVDQLSSVSSLRIAGTLEFPGQESQEIIVVKKGGDMIRVMLKTQVWQQVSTFTPKDAWRAYWRMGELKQVEDMDPAEVESLRRYAYVNSELFMALQNSWNIEYAGQRDFNYKMAHVFEVKTGPDVLVRFFIDPSTYLDVGREDRVYGPDGGLTLTRHVYSDHFESNGLMLPGTVETYVNEELKQTFLITQMDVNPGVLDASFARPAMDKEPAKQ